jgi:hypothetical protein
MSDITTIRNALSTLDPANASEWTANGLPAMEAVRLLCGEDVTRRMVDAAAPGFTRENRAIPGEVNIHIGDDWAAKSPNERAKAAAEILNAAESPDDGNGGTPPSAADVLRAKIADLGEAHRLLVADIKAAQARDEQIVADIDAAQRELDALEPPDTPAQAYARLMARSDEERRALAEALAKNQPYEMAPIDRKYQGRRSQRPNGIRSLRAGRVAEAR